MHGIQFIPTNQKGNFPISYVGADDSATDVQAALLLAGKAGTVGILAGVTARLVDHGVVQDTDAAGNLKMRRYSDLTGNPDDRYVVDATYGLLGHSGSPGGSTQLLVSGYSLGAPIDDAVDTILAATAMPGAASATGIHAAVTLTTATQTVTTGITNPAGLVPTIVGNDTDMLGTVAIHYTDLLGTTGLTLLLALNGTTTVVPTLDQVPNGVDTIQSIVLPPQTTDGSETVSVGTKGKVIIAALTDPDFPRVPSITGNASGIDSVAEILGYDRNQALVHDTYTANGTATVNGTKALATVQSVLIGPKHNSSGDTISFGVSDILGLPYKMDHDAFIAAQFGTAHEATRPTVTYNGTNLCGNTILLSSDLDGSKSVIVDFVRCDAPPTGFVTA